MKLPVVLPEELNHSSHLKPSALSCPCGVSGLYRWLLEEKGDKAELGAAFFCENGAVGWYRVISSYSFKGNVLAEHV